MTQISHILASPVMWQPLPMISQAKPDQHESAIRIAKTRSIYMVMALILALSIVGLQAIRLTVLQPARDNAMKVKPLPTANENILATKRAKIVDRYGQPIATSLFNYGLVVQPKDMVDKSLTASKLANIFPEFDEQELYQRFTKNNRYQWLVPNLTGAQQKEILEIGEPGLSFEERESRVYVQGSLFSHVVGFTNFEDQGTAGIEQKFDQFLTSGQGDLVSSLDSKLQHNVRELLAQKIEESQAKGGGALVMDIKTGEILSLVSLPDFDPNRPLPANNPRNFNMMLNGQYELGSTMKIINTALYLSAEDSSMSDKFDASRPLPIGRFLVHDYHAQNRTLSLTEVFIHSSNIGSALMAKKMGSVRQREFFKKLRLLDCQPLELTICSRATRQDKWNDTSAMTIAYGHGFSLNPVTMASAVAAVLNDGIYYPPTLVKRNTPPEGERMVSPEVSEKLRKLMYLNSIKGTGEFAVVKGMVVGGKTGTTEKIRTDGRGYDKTKLLSSYIGAFPMQDPHYLVYVLVDEPKGSKKTYGYATGGWIAAPVAGAIISYMAGLYVIPSINEDSVEIRKALDVEGFSDPKPHNG